MVKICYIVAALIGAASLAGAAIANPARDAILARILAQAKVESPGFAAFSPQRGETLFRAKHLGGKDDTPSCTACHTDKPQGVGQTRAGKPIEPMALSKTPDRYADAEKIEKWFDRNCKGVLGRICTAAEKGDFLSYMISQ